MDPLRFGNIGIPVNSVERQAAIVVTATTADASQAQAVANSFEEDIYFNMDSNPLKLFIHSSVPLYHAGWIDRNELQIPFGRYL